ASASGSNTVSTPTETLRSDRRQVVDYLRRQLVGPIGGLQEELDGSPLDRYLLGVIYPQSANADEVEKEEEAQAAVAGEEEADHENPISMAFERLPASMGLSFFVVGSEQVECGVWGAVYHLLEKEKGKERWRRESLAEPTSPDIHVLHRPAADERDKRTEVL